MPNYTIIRKWTETWTEEVCVSAANEDLAEEAALDLKRFPKTENRELEDDELDIESLEEDYDGPTEDRLEDLD